MSIQYVCKCGKRLRGRSDAVARGLICPACGALVNTPLERPLTVDFGRTRAGRISQSQARHEPVQVGWEPNEPAAQAAEELVTRIRQGKNDDFIELTDASARPHAPAPFVYRSSKFRQSWDPGTVWYHCLIFPRPAWMRVFLVGGILGLFAVAAPFEVRRLLTLDESLGAKRWLAGGAIAMAGLLVLALVSVWFVCILEAEKAGKLTVTSLSLRRAGPALRSLGLVLCSALGGPVFLAGVALWFWIHTGRIQIVDQIILGELLGFVFAYWLFSLAEVSLSPWPRFANPLRVAELVHYLGFRSVILAVLASGFAWLALLLVTHALNPIGNNAEVLVTGGLAILCIEYGSILLRLTGMWCRMALKKRALAMAHDSNSTPGSPVLTSPIK
jgi:hypothetical protein